MGAALRLYSYVASPALSVDDAMLTLNIGTRSFTQLLTPLALDQTAPPLFLWILKLCTLAAGLHDPVLRLVPFVAGCILPYAVWRVAGRLGSDGSALLAAAFTAASPILVQYSVSAKPYETDALMAVVLIGLTLHAMDRPDDGRATVRLAVAGVVAVLISTPAVFVIAACLATLGSSGATWTDRRPLRLGIVAGVWALAFAAVYAGILRPASESPYLRGFWAGRMLSAHDLFAPGRVWDLVKRVPIEAFLPFRKLSEPEVLSWALCLGGLTVLARSRGVKAMLLGGPVAVMLGAALASLYPVAPRLALFVAPSICIILAMALEGPHLERLGRAAASIRIVSVVAVLGLIVTAAPTSWWPPDSRGLVTAFQEARTPGENVYIFSGVVPDWTVYSTDWRSPDSSRLSRILTEERTDGPAFHNAAGRGGRGAPVLDTAGRTLTIPTGDHVELLGLAPGTQFREGAMFSQPHPDEGWARHEARRIADAAHPGVWVAIAYAYQGADRDLLAALDSAGSRDQTVARRGATLYHYRFGP